MNPDFDLSTLITAIGDYTEDAILVTEAEPVNDPGPRILWVNPAFTRMTGYTLEEIKGKSPRILQGPDTSPITVKEIRRALLNWEPVRVEIKNYKKDGTPFWVEFDVRPVADDTGWFRFWVSIQRETTKRRERELQLETTNKALDTAPIGLGLLSADLQLTYANRALARIFFPSEEPPDLPIAYTSWVARSQISTMADGDALGALWPRTHLQGMMSTPFKVDQVVNNVWHSFRRVILPDGTSLLMAEDATERRDLQDQVDHYLKLESMGQLTGGVAHDFNNILAVILGNLELMRMDVGAGERDGFISEAINAVLKGRQLTHQLLAFARKSRLEKERVELGEFFVSMETMLERTLPTSIALKFTAAPDLPAIFIDRVQLETALLNLALNARDAMNGSGTIQIDARLAASDDPRLPSPIGGQPAPFIQLTVSDTGHGIPKHLLTRVVEPFYTTKPAGSGSGLGLSMVHGFVEQSGGRVLVTSKPQMGTSIHMYLPAMADINLQMPAAEHHDPNALAAEARVLIVEDDPGVCKILRLFLSDLNWDVEIATTGDEAITKLDAAPNPYSLVLTDLVMPGEKQGNDVVDHVGRTMPNCAVIVMSGNPDTAIKRGLKGDVLLKPVRRADLLDAISDAMSPGQA